MLKIYLFVFSMLICGCELVSSENNQVLDYSRPVEYVNYNALDLNISYRKAGQSRDEFLSYTGIKRWDIQNRKFYFTGENAEMDVLYPDAENPAATIIKKIDMHIGYKVELTSNRYFNFQGIHALKLIYNITYNQTVTSWQPTGFYRIDLLKKGEKVYKYFLHPEEAIKYLINDPDEYKVRWSFELNSGTNEPTVPFSPNKISFIVDLSLLGFYK